MRSHLPLVLTASIIATSAGCAPSSQTACAQGTGTPMALFTLYLGEAIPGRADLTKREWQSFLEQTVTTNLPNGYTVLDAAGAWMNPVTHNTSHEPTRLLVVAMPGTPDSLAAINRVRTAYQDQFHQQLVGMTIQPVCGTF